MAWSDLGNCLAITRRSRVVATALMYGLTLTVRFTSAAGDDADSPAQASQGANAVTSVMIDDTARALTRDWLPAAAQPISLRRGSLSSAPGCRAACERARRAPFVSSCAAHR
ncbi:hypothetical protein FBZ93_105412 [Bradyrhizobium macuxiense]|uniref:Uncharacterized protein n=1 Tax=Bradyrhizobium macuxiense TaxID=1755647 RepID=A0A560LYW6_9BRAD|nr:hypothetical protein FBZ93_105412 [Bradyrhizobium macuxiense]